MEADQSRRYSARVAREVETPKGTWRVIDVDVVRAEDARVVGQYRRNYPYLFRTFEPFRLGDRELALYSPDYTGTRVLSLPDCADIGGEPRRADGFCPTDFYVPQSDGGEPLCGMAFVAGCVWGDDRSWKIQVLNLSDIDAGTVARDERFGYIEVPEGLTLRDAVKVHREPWMFTAEDPNRPEWTVELAVLHRFRLDSGESVPLDPYD